MATATAKHPFEARLWPLARHVPLHPHAISVLACAAMVAAGWSVTAHRDGVAGALVLVSGALDVLDGIVARAKRLASPLGALVDRVLDRVADLCLFAGVLLGGRVGLALGLYVLGTVVLASYISSCLEAATGTNVGERLSLRALRLSVLAVAALADTLAEGMVVLAVVGTGAVLQRLHYAVRTLSDRQARTAAPNSAAVEAGWNDSSDNVRDVS